MKLYIDTTDSSKLSIVLDGKKRSEEARADKAQRLLSIIDNELTRHKLTLSDLSEIEVNTGPGSYTGIRVGISVASALGFALKIPVNGKEVTKEGAPEAVY